MSVKPGNVRKFDSCREKSCQGKLFIVNLTFEASSVFST